MSYTVVEPLSRETVKVGGRELPVAAVLEDSVVGVRVLFSTDIEITKTMMSKAIASDVRYIVVGRRNDWRWITIDSFNEHSVVRPRTAAVTPPPLGYWHEHHGKMPSGSALLLTPTAVQAQSFVHLHAHSEFSALDGMSRVSEMVERAVADNQPAVALTDHGVCAGHIKLANACSKADIKPIFGMEANWVERLRKGDPDRSKEPDHPDNARRVLGEYRHLILLAENDRGLRNLWAASTAANHPDAFYGRPRMDWDILDHHSEGLLCTSACLRGPLALDILSGREDRAKATLARLMAIFDGRFWLEIQTNPLDGWFVNRETGEPEYDATRDQHAYNRAILALADEFSLPVIVAVDSHYPCPEDMDVHQVWLAAQTKQELSDDMGLFQRSYSGEDPEYHLFTMDEVRASLQYLPEDRVEAAIAQTLEVAERCEVRVNSDPVAPIFSKKGSEEQRRNRDTARMRKLCLEAFLAKGFDLRDDSQVYVDRLNYEIEAISGLGFSGYFLMVWFYVNIARKNRVLIGPGRGSGAGSLVAYLLGITGIDPIEARLMFERFINPGRKSLPDFDIDFPSSKRGWLMDAIQEQYGVDNVVRVGTHMHKQNKGVIRSIAKVNAVNEPIEYIDIEAICAVIDGIEAGSAGLGVSWNDLVEMAEEELAPYVERYPQLFHYSGRLVGRVTGYGKHPAGLVISIGEPLVDRLPMRIGEDGVPIVEFDFEDCEFIGLVKFDVLTLRTLDTIQMCMDLVLERHGVDIDPDAWTTEYEDADVWNMLADGHTLGVFQVETYGGTRLCKEVKPQSLFDLSDIIALDRPGPMRSGLKDQYLDRRDGREEVEFADPRLEDVLHRTFGCIIYQEDVMATCQVLAGYTLQEADDMRRILGKKKVEAIEEEEGKFISGCARMEVEKKAAQRTFDQMREFAKYSFNRAHSMGYAILGYWCAWFKYHYPAEFVTALLSTVDQKRIGDFIEEARRLELRLLPPHINDSKIGFTIVDDETIRYGLDSVKGVGIIAAQAIIDYQPYTSVQDFLDRKGGKADIGVVQTLTRIGALDCLEPNRRALEAWVMAEKDGSNYRCIHVDMQHVGPNGLRCNYDWDNEPVELTPTGRRKKAKPPPKKCTKACRQYTPVERVLPELPAYTDEEIRGIEREVLGFYLSSTPFDDVPGYIYEEWNPVPASALLEADTGSYPIIATVTRVKKWHDRGGHEMAFLRLYAQDGDIDVTCFKKAWKRCKAHLEHDRIIIARVNRQDDGRFTFVDSEPIILRRSRTLHAHQEG